MEDWNLLWNGLTATSTAVGLFVTVFIYFLARNELKKSNSISELDLYYRLKADLFNEFSIRMYRAILDEKLLFVVTDVKGHFRIGDETIQTSDFGLNFLGHLEDISLFLDEGMITYEKINAGFGSFILEVGNSNPVIEYINFARTTYQDNELWTGFENVYLKIYTGLSPNQKAQYRPSFTVVQALSDTPSKKDGE